MKTLMPIGDPENPEKKRLTFDQIKEWNSFMDKNKDGSDLLTLYQRYKKVNPKGSISYDALNNEMNLLVNKSKGLADTRNELIKDNNLNTGNRFPVMKEFDGQNFGVVNGEMKTEGATPKAKLPDYRIQKEVPDYVTELKWHPGWQQPYYLDGDEIVFVDRKFYNSDRFLKPPVGMANGLALK
jgi:hypothetical protein